MIVNFFYFSGTGNTEYYVDYLLYQSGGDSSKYDITADHDFKQALISSDVIVLAFPTLLGVASTLMYDFIEKYENCFLDKDVALLSVSTIMSGDALIPIKRKLSRCGAHVFWARWLNKPFTAADRRLVSIKSREQNEKTLQAELPKLRAFLEDIKAGRTNVYANVFSRLLGVLQRMIYLPKIKKIQSGLRINLAQCNYCLECIDVCPTKNLFIGERKVCSGDKCVNCYRCVNLCKKRAISINTKYKPEKTFSRIEFVPPKKQGQQKKS